MGDNKKQQFLNNLDRVLELQIIPQEYPRYFQDKTNVKIMKTLCKA